METRADLVEAREGSRAVYLGDGAGGFVRSASWTDALNAMGFDIVDADGIDTGVRLQDVDGDARPDFLRAAPEPTVHEVYLNTGSGWSYSPSFSNSLASITEVSIVERRYIERELCEPEPLVDGGTPPPPPPECADLVENSEKLLFVREDGDAPGVQLGDVDGDGLTDIVWNYATTSELFNLPSGDGSDINGRAPAVVRAIYLNTGTGWAKDARLTDALEARTAPPPTPFDPNDPDHYRLDFFTKDAKDLGYSMSDVNGDGLADMVRTHADFDRAVFLNTGSDWLYDFGYSASLNAHGIISTSFDADDVPINEGLIPVDFNGDGLLDYVRADDAVTMAYRNTGTEWVPDATMTANLSAVGVLEANADGELQGQKVADVNGDGAADLIRARSDLDPRVFLGRSANIDLLEVGTNAFGGVARFVYASNSTFDHSNDAGVNTLPLRMPVVTRLAREDGRGGQFVHQYAYSNGVFSDQRFRGYANVEEIDPAGLRIQSRFLQSDHLIGRTDVEHTYASGVLRREDRMEYDLVSAAPGITQVRSVLMDKVIHEVDGSQTERTTMAYDDYLNVVELEKHGDLAVSEDNATTYYTYASGSSRDIVNRTASIRVRGHDGRLVSESLIEYDGLPHGEVEKGNATRTTDTVMPGTTVSRSATFDTYGNIATSTDREGHTTSFTYDPLLHKYPVRTVDALGRLLETETSPLFGRVEASTDWSNNTTTFSYDEFGRVVVEARPGDECSPLGTRSYVYSALGSPLNQFVRIRATERPGESDTYETTAYFDGLLRGYRRLRDGQGEPIEELVEHNYRGEIISQTRPRYLSEPEERIVFERDLFDRVIRTINPDGTSIDVAYQLGAHEVTDQAGHTTRFVTDVYDKVTAVEQVVDGTLVGTSRTYDELGRLVEVVSPLGQTTTITYDMVNNRTSVDDPNVGLTTYAYDGNGNMVEAIDPDGRVLRHTYNAASQLVRREVPADDIFGNPTYDVVELSYGNADAPNATGRLVRVEDQVGTLELDYDPRGNVVRRTRAINRWPSDNRYITGYAYDSLDRLTSITYPDGYRVHYEYDEGGGQARVVDGDGAMIAEAPAFTSAGQPLAINYRNGIETTFSYDDNRRLAEVVTQQPTPEPSLFNPFPQTPDPIQDFQYVYDARNNVASITDTAYGNDQAFTYDERSFLVRAVGSYGDRVYDYDAGGNLIRRGNIVYGHDEQRAQLAECAIDLDVADRWINGVVNDPRIQGCAEQLLEPDSGLDSDGRARLQQIIDRSSFLSQRVGESITLDYDSRGNVEQRDEQRYVFDRENRLVEVRDRFGVPLQRNVYDATGSRVIRDIEPGKETTYIDGIYEHDRWTGRGARHIALAGRPVATLHKPLSFLIDGTEATPLEICHDPALAAVDQTRHTLDYMLGKAAFSSKLNPTQRAEMRQRANAVASTVVVLFIVAILLAARMGFVPRLVGVGRGGLRRLRFMARSLVACWHHVRLRPARAGIALLVCLTSVVTSCRAPNGDPSGGVEKVESSLLSVEESFYHLDHLGNVHLVSDEDARVRQRTEVTPFGERHVHDPSLTHPEAEETFNGHVYDEFTGLYDFGARHYDPFMGRFVSADPEISAELNPIGLNRYAFNANNPVRYIDPDGNGFWDVFAVVVIAIAAVAVTIVTAGVGSVLIAAAIGFGVGLVVGGVVGAIVSYATTGSLNLGVVAAFALAGALVGTSVGGLIATAPILVGGASAGVASQAAALAFLGSLVGAVGTGIFQGVYNGPESIVYGIVMGWSIGALVGLSHGYGAKLIGAEFGAELVLSTAAGAIGFTPGGLGEHALGVLKGDRDPFQGPGKELGNPTPGGSRKKGSFDLGGAWDAFKELLEGLPNPDPGVLNGNPNKPEPYKPTPCEEDPRLCPSF